MHKYIFYKKFHRLLFSHLIINRELNFNLNLGLVVPLHAAGLLVLGEVGLEREGLAAVGTAEGLVRAVRLHMRSQIALVRKRLAAHGTPEGLLARVGADVTLQEPGPGKAFAAVGTAAAGPVGAQVHGERGRAAVLTPTGGTVQLLTAGGCGPLGGVGVTADGGAVGLAVAGKVAAAGVAFPALPAGVGGGGGVALPAAAPAAALGPK